MHANTAMGLYLKMIFLQTAQSGTRNSGHALQFRQIDFLQVKVFSIIFFKGDNACDTIACKPLLLFLLSMMNIFGLIFGCIQFKISSEK